MKDYGLGLAGGGAKGGYEIGVYKIKKGINSGDIKNLDSRYLSSANAVFNIKDKKLKIYRRFLALYRPKLLVSNLLLSLISFRNAH